MKETEDLILSIECHKIWLPNEVKFSGLPHIVCENFWIKSTKSTVNQ